MSIEIPKVETPREPSLTEVVAGIVADFQKLASQQLALLRAELRTDWEKAQAVARPMIVGGALIVVGAILLGIAVALGLHWSLSPAGTDPSRFPLWACFGVAALAFVAIGGAFVAIGTKALQTFNPLPNESVDALEKSLKAIVDASPKAVRS